MNTKDIKQAEVAEAARLRRNAYQRDYYRRNKEKVQAAQRAYWERRVLREREELAAEIDAEARDNLRERGINV